jgi:hypothetical protein
MAVPYLRHVLVEDMNLEIEFRELKIQGSSFWNQ